jgi:hypothetical protein
MWEFRKEEQRKWYWKEVDDMGRLLQRSASYFKERIDCVAHAMRHGYIHPRQRALARLPVSSRDARPYSEDSGFDAAAARAYGQSSAAKARQPGGRRGTG